MDIPKSEWGPGPWQDEPDEHQWVDDKTGYACMIRRNPLGALNGYAAVPPTHPAWGLHYEGCLQAEYEVYSEAVWKSMRDETACVVPRPKKVTPVGQRLSRIRVHGGLTWSGPLDAHERDWWFGFDCGHFGDLMPAMMAFERSMATHFLRQPNFIYRDIAFVASQVGMLARRLQWIANASGGARDALAQLLVRVDDQEKDEKK